MITCKVVAPSHKGGAPFSFLGRIVLGASPFSCVENIMSQRESRKSRKIMDALRAEGWFCFKVHGGAMMMAGLPDVICCAEGLFIGIETKHDETREGTSTTQDLRRDQIREADGVYEVATTPAEAVAVVRRALELRSC